MEVDMAEKKKSLRKEIEDNMACSAFAEAGEPCPICPEADKMEPGAKAKKPRGEKISICQSVEEDMACTAFAEQGEPCQIDAKKKWRKSP